MKVSELLHALKLFPQDAEVYLPNQSTCGTIKLIRMGKNKKTREKVCIYAGYDHQVAGVEVPSNE